jgi:hypothetical protein
MNNMIKRRTLLSALPLAFISACARAQPAATSATTMTAPAGDMLAALTGGAGRIAWLSLTGTVRESRANANVRPAKLLRALMADGGGARIFDIWQMGSEPAIAAASQAGTASNWQVGPNDGGVESLWLNRAFAHPALDLPIEASRLSATAARVLAIDATQIWLLEGGLLPAAPALDGPALAAFTTWRAASIAP